jgi:predicted O-methyltransferase YrrM
VLVLVSCANCFDYTMESSRASAMAMPSFNFQSSNLGYEEFLDLTLDDLLAEDGMVLADNVLFRGMVTAVPEGRRPEETAQESEVKRFRDIAEKLHAFNLRFLEDDPRTEGLILDQDDGLGIIWRKSSTWNGVTVI